MKASNTKSLPRTKCALGIGLVAVILFSISQTIMAGHPGEEESNGMNHPPEPLPTDALVPSIHAKLSKDMMDGFNLELALTNFKIKVPHRGIPDYQIDHKQKIMHGHLHLYLNGRKVMRLYDGDVHIPMKILKPGVNSLTVSINNHMHGTYTHSGKEIQTTFLFEADSKSKDFIKSVYSWPKHATD